MNNQNLPHGYELQGKQNKYIIDHALGQGAFGITYLAKYKTMVTGQMGSGSAWVQVCIKEFFMRDLSNREESTGSLHEATGNSLVSRYRRAFLREANNLARMQHPNIVNVFEVIEANNTAYIVMEYIDGGNLDDYITRKGHLTEEEALCLFHPICDAMNYMHAQHILHLDLKPKNVMLDEAGKPYLIDFGLSKQYTEDGEPESSTTIGLGTPGYAPSEQAEQRDGDKTFRSTIDVYALGGTLYKMLTGNTPPKATEISEAVLDGTNLVLEKLRAAGVSQTTSSVISKAMYPSSRKRYQSVEELMTALGWRQENTKQNALETKKKEVINYTGSTLRPNEETRIVSQEQPITFKQSSEFINQKTPITTPQKQEQSQKEELRPSTFLWLMFGIGFVILLIYNMTTCQTNNDKPVQKPPLVSNSAQATGETSTTTPTPQQPIQQQLQQSAKQYGTSSISESYAGKKYHYDINVNDGKLTWNYKGYGGNESKTLNCNPDVSADVIISEYKGLAYWYIASELIFNMVEEDGIFGYDVYTGAKNALGKCVVSLSQVKDTCPNAFKKSQKTYNDLINAENGGADALWEELTLLSYAMGENPIDVCDIY